MKIETQTHENHQIKLIVESDSEELNKYMQRAAREISRKGKIPGFRPGKAPYDVIKRMYGDQAIQTEAIELMVDEIYPKALEEAKIEPSGPGKLEEIPSQTPPKFVFLVPLKPEVQLCDYHSIRKDYVLGAVPEEEITAIVRRLQVNNAMTESVDGRSASENDVVSITLDAQILQLPEGEDGELIKSQALDIVIDPEGTSADDPWPYPGFSRELIGLSVNDEKRVEYTYPTDAAFEMLRDKTVEFNIKINNISALIMPDINNEFAQTVGEFDSAEALLSNIRKRIEEQKQSEYDDKYFSELIDEIVKQSKVKYPDHLLDQEVESVLESITKNLSQRGLDLQTYLKTINSDHETYIEKNVKPTAKSQLERSLVLHEIIVKEDIKVQQDDLQSEMANALQELENIPSYKNVSKRRANDIMMNVTMNAANRLLNRNLLQLLKAIATGEIEKKQDLQENNQSEISE